MGLFIGVLILALMVSALFIIKGHGGLEVFWKVEEDGGQPAQDFSMYEKKRYLFDTTPEFNLFKVLLKLFGEQYHIFPEINYSHLIQPKKSSWAEERKYRSRIDRKSADFVICEKSSAVPVLVIELDGSAHRLPKKQQRDEFIDELARQVGLPILHLDRNQMNPESVRKQVQSKLDASKA